MAIAATYIQLQTQIADEIGDRSDLLPSLLTSSVNSPIKRAIASAIAKWERERFYFNEVDNQAVPLFTTVAGQEFYTTADAAGIMTAPEIDSLRVLIGGVYQTLMKRSWAYINDIASNPVMRGQPTDWAYLGSNIRLYPIPGGAYPVAATRLQRVAALSADADTNVWTTDGFDLIKCEAKLHLAQQFLHDAQLAAEMTAAIHGPRGYLYMLKAETARRAKSGIKPWQF